MSLISKQDNMADLAAEFVRILLGKDLRKLRNSDRVIQLVTDQRSFDELFKLTFHHERALVMRAVDAVEKITAQHEEYLQPHKKQLLGILNSADHKELKWHLAQLLPRVKLDEAELKEVWHALNYWALNRNESKIVRVNALQGLFDISRKFPGFQNEFNQTIATVANEPIPSLQARIKRLKHFAHGKI